MFSRRLPLKNQPAVVVLSGRLSNEWRSRETTILLLFGVQKPFPSQNSSIMIRPFSFVIATLIFGPILITQFDVTAAQAALQSENHLPSSAPTSIEDQWNSVIKPLIESHCIDCHDTGGEEGGIDLGKFSSLKDVDADLETWNKVLSVIESKSMPPSDADQPSQSQRNRIATWILNAIAAHDSEKSLGRVRRLTRIEYENTIRDLFRLSRNCFNNSSRILKTEDYFQPSTHKMPRYVFGVSYYFNAYSRFSDLPDVGTLPVDPPPEHGFSNDQSALSLSPLMIENYLSVASDLVNSEGFSEISGLWNPLFLPPQPQTGFRLAHESDHPSDRSVDSDLLDTAKNRLSVFLPRAFRRDVAESEINRYHRLFAHELASTGQFTMAMRTTIAAALVSPSFLFRQEFKTPGDSSNDPEADQNFALANRLSYFLWSSMPDESLMQAARERRLTDPAELKRQVRRMMADKRVKALSTQFGMQWLKTAKVPAVRPDREIFPTYYDAPMRKPPVAVSMTIEQLLLFETIMVEDRSILDFVQSDYAYLNRQLMDWYQLRPDQLLDFTPPEEPYEDFYRVKWPHGHRGGVIASGAMMISTSTSKRTSPVFRGAWIMDVIFNAPPPPAPADVPPLESDGETDPHEATNIRQRLEEHRKNPVCASCHDRIDPLGFAMENFDPVGKWRKKYRNGQPVDASTEFQGRSFSGIATLKNLIRRDKKTFVRAFVGHVMTYALGRELHFSDEPELRRIADEVMANDCRFHSVIEAIVLSKPFS